MDDELSPNFASNIRQIWNELIRLSSMKNFIFYSVKFGLYLKQNLQTIPNS